MLSGLDETLMHQAPVTFDEAAVSDHRFFDRTLITAFHPDGEAAVVVGMGVYKNMNVMDGFALVQADGRQHNLRLSRALRPIVEGAVLGPVSLEIVEPFRTAKLRLAAGADHAAAFDLTLQTDAAPYEEHPHFSRVDGRLVNDYRRYAQVGVASGSLRLGERSWDVQDWFLFKDHSWGVRPGVGGFEPFTGTRVRDPAKGFLLLYLAFAWGDRIGVVQLQEDGSGAQVYLTGHVTGVAAGSAIVDIVELRHDLALKPGRTLASGSLMIRTETGETLDIVVEPLARAWSYKGGGYEAGYSDGQGLGAWRGRSLQEADIWDLAEDGHVILPDGTKTAPFVREQPVRLSVNGQPGFGHLPLYTLGELPRFNLGSARP